MQRVRKLLTESRQEMHQKEVAEEREREAGKKACHPLVFKFHFIMRTFNFFLLLHPVLPSTTSSLVALAIRFDLIPILVRVPV